MRHYISVQHHGMRHWIDQWLLQKAGWVHYQGLATYYKLHTHWNHAKHQCCVIKHVVKFVSDPEILALARVNISATSWYEALYWPMIVAVAEGWLGPLPRSNSPLQAAYTLEPCQISMLCHEKCSQIFIRSGNSRPCQSIYQCNIMVWGTVLTNNCCIKLVGSITTKVWQSFTSCISTGTMPDINDV